MALWLEHYYSQIHVSYWYFIGNPPLAVDYEPKEQRADHCGDSGGPYKLAPGEPCTKGASFCDNTSHNVPMNIPRYALQSGFEEIEFGS